MRIGRLFTGLIAVYFTLQAAGCGNSPNASKRHKAGDIETTITTEEKDFTSYIDVQDVVFDERIEHRLNDVNTKFSEVEEIKPITIPYEGENWLLFVRLSGKRKIEVTRETEYAQQSTNPNNIYPIISERRRDISTFDDQIEQDLHFAATGQHSPLYSTLTDMISPYFMIIDAPDVPKTPELERRLEEINNNYGDVHFELLPLRYAGFIDPFSYIRSREIVLSENGEEIINAVSIRPLVRENAGRTGMDTDALWIMTGDDKWKDYYYRDYPIHIVNKDLVLKK